MQEQIHATNEQDVAACAQRPIDTLVSDTVRLTVIESCLEKLTHSYKALVIHVLCNMLSP